MDQHMQDFIIDILDEDKDLTLASLREFGHTTWCARNYRRNALDF